MLNKLNNEKGISIIIAIVVGMMLAVIGFATISTVVTDAHVGANHLMSSQAFWLAESGIELTYHWLQNQDPAPPGTQPFFHYQNEPGGSGIFTVIVDPDDNNPNTYLKRYTLIAEGYVSDAIRAIEVEMEMTTFNKFAYLTGDEGGTIWFNTGDFIEGPVHSNDQISITGSPTFKGKITSSAKSFNKGATYNPDFQDGYQLDVPPVQFPVMQDLIDNYWAENTDPPKLVIDARFGKHASINFKSNGTLTYNVWQWAGKKKVYDIKNATANVADLDGLIYVKGSVDVEGTLDGEVTVAASENVYITDDLVYKDSDSNGKPKPDCDDMLGVIAKQDVVVADNNKNQNDVVVNGAILALGDSFTVEDYKSGKPRGDLTIWGSLSQKVRGPVGTFNWKGQVSGYQKDYHYDQRFLDIPPPYFPTTGKYDFSYWKEVGD